MQHHAVLAARLETVASRILKFAQGPPILRPATGGWAAPRADFKNGWYHVTARGNNRQRIFFDERDRRHFLELVGQMIERHAVEVHACVLMDSHYNAVGMAFSRLERRLAKERLLRLMANRILNENT